MLNLKVAPACPRVHLACPTRNELAAVATAARMFPCVLKRTSSLHPMAIAHTTTKVSGECRSVRASCSPPDFQADEMAGTTQTVEWETVEVDRIPPQLVPQFKSAVAAGAIRVVAKGIAAGAATEVGMEGTKYAIKYFKENLEEPLKEFFHNLPEDIEEGWHKVEDFVVDDIAKPVEQGWHEVEDFVVDDIAKPVAQGWQKVKDFVVDDIAKPIEQGWNKFANGVANAFKSLWN